MKQKVNNTYACRLNRLAFNSCTTDATAAALLYINGCLWTVRIDVGRTQSKERTFLRTLLFESMGFDDVLCCFIFESRYILCWIVVEEIIERSRTVSREWCQH